MEIDILACAGASALRATPLDVAEAPAIDVGAAGAAVARNMAIWLDMPLAGVPPGVRPVDSSGMPTAGVPGVPLILALAAQCYRYETG